MAKILRQSPPTSSVARLLDPQAAGRATATPIAVSSERTVAEVALPVVNSVTERHTETESVIKREIVLNQLADDTLSAMIQAYRKTTGARLSASHVVRAMLAGVAHSLPALEREITRLGRLRLPSNARGFERERARFERKLAAVFVAGMRAAAVMDADD